MALYVDILNIENSKFSRIVYHLKSRVVKFEYSLQKNEHRSLNYELFKEFYLRVEKNDGHFKN